VQLVAELLAGADEHLVHRLARPHAGDVEVGLAGGPAWRQMRWARSPIGSSSGSAAVSSRAPEAAARLPWR
jgi:hypothetical protein